MTESTATATNQPGGAQGRSRRWRRAILTGLLAWGIAFLLAEGAVRYLDIFDPPAFDENADYEYLMRPDQSVSTRGIRFRINHAGFRGPDFGSKALGTTRLAFVGDSITYGGGSIPDNELFVNRVAVQLTARRQTPYESLNLSAPGWGIQNMAEYIRTRGVHEADWVVWMVSSVDFRRPKTTRADNGFWASKPWSRFAYGIAAMLYKSNLTVTGSNSSPSGSDIIETNLRRLNSSLVDAGHAGLKRALFIVPVATETAGTRADAGRFESLARELGVPFLHLNSAFQNAGSADLFSDGVHLTARGHAIAADAISVHLDGLAGPPSPMASALRVR